MDANALAKALNLTPEQAQELVDSGVLDEKSQLLQQQLQHAQAMKTPMPQGQMIGDRYVAPSPFAMLASGAAQFMGGRKEKAIEAQQQALLGQRKAGNMAAMQVNQQSQKEYQDLLRELLRRRGGGAPGASDAPMPGPNDGWAG